MPCTLCLLVLGEKQHAFLIHAVNVYTICAFSFSYSYNLGVHDDSTHRSTALPWWLCWPVPNADKAAAAVGSC